MWQSPSKLSSTKTNQIMIRWTICCLFLLSTVSCQTPAQPSPQSEVEATEPLTVFLVRHAEKESGDNPGLTPEGQLRARQLADLLEAVPLDAVFSTKFRRTELTADPIATSKGLPIMDYDPSDLPAFAKKLQKEYQGKTVLVVGHSNTTPTLAGLLDGTQSYPAFEETEYGNIMMVTLPMVGKHKTMCLKY
jgi:2,3-bisphosphoglycerate-dependent phosphoglycerate mutase